MSASFDFAQDKRGFTLIELLVVIAIIAILAIVTISNFGSFGERQKLKGAALDVANLIKQAQVNASSRVACPVDSSTYGAKWWVEFQVEQPVFNIRCQIGAGTANVVKTYILPTGLQILSVTDGGICSTSVPYQVDKVIFSPLYNEVSFTDNDGTFCSNSQLMVITVKNTKINETKVVKVDKGGSVSVQ